MIQRIREEEVIEIIDILDILDLDHTHLDEKTDQGQFKETDIDEEVGQYLQEIVH